MNAVSLDSSPFSNSLEAYPAQIGPKGQYQRRRLLARTNMSVVLVYWEEALKREVVIKYFPASQLGLQDTAINDRKRRFEREKRIVGILDPLHQVVPVYGADVYGNGDPYIILRYMASGSLADKMAASHLLPHTQVLAFAKELAEVLDRLHGLGILHRDIKPGNLLLGADGRLFLADFGIAHLLPSAPPILDTNYDYEQLTFTGWGTPGYKSPEQHARGKEGPESDLYAAAVILYELLAGSHPFRRTQAQYQPSANIPDIREFNPALPATLNVFFRRALAHAADDRFASGHQLVQALHAALFEPPISSVRVYSSLYLQLQNVYQHTDYSAVKSLDISPDGKHLAYSLTTPGRFYIWHPNESAPLPIEQPDQQTITQLCFSDNNHMIVKNNMGALNRWDTSGTHLLKLPFRYEHRSARIVARADLVALATRNGLHLWSYFTSQWQLVSTSRIDAVCIHPHSSAIAWADVNNIYYSDDQGTSERLLFILPGEKAMLWFDPTAERLAVIAHKTLSILDTSQRSQNASFTFGLPTNKAFLTPDWQMLFALTRDGQLRAWDMSGPRLLHLQFICNSHGQHQASITHLAVSADNRLLTTGDNQGKLCIWEIQRT